MQRLSPKVIVLDLGNVVVDIDSIQSKLATVGLLKPYCSVQEAEELYDELSILMEMGSISMETMINRIQRKSRGVLMPEQVINAWNAMLLGVPDTRMNTLIELGKRHEMYILSNTDAGHMAWLRKHIHKRFGIEKFDENLFTYAFMSYKMKMHKPDHEIYEAATKEIGMDKSDILFLDDKLENVEAALEVGWHSIQIRKGVDTLESISALHELI